MLSIRPQLCTVHKNRTIWEISSASDLTPGCKLSDLWHSRKTSRTDEKKSLPSFCPLFNFHSAQMEVPEACSLKHCGWYKQKIVFVLFILSLGKMECYWYIGHWSLFLTSGMGKYLASTRKGVVIVLRLYFENDLNEHILKVKRI